MNEITRWDESIPVKNMERGTMFFFHSNYFMKVGEISAVQLCSGAFCTFKETDRAEPVSCLTIREAE